MPRTVETVSVVRSLSSAVSGLACVVLLSAAALAADKVTFLTSWFAQAEHGGFYQAKATGTLREGRARRHHQDGRPAGQRHAASARRRDRRHDGLRPAGAQDAGAGPAGHHHRHVVPVRPARHDDARQRRRASPISRTRPSWLPPPAAPPGGRGSKSKYKYTDEQTRPYTFNLQPFFADKNIVQQSYPVLRAVPGQAAGRAGQVLPVRARRLSALRHDDGRQPRTSSTRTRTWRRVSSRRRSRAGSSYLTNPRAGQRADQGRQSEDVRRADRLRRRADEGAQGARRRRRADHGRSASSPRRAGRRPTTSWSAPACSSPRSTGSRVLPTASSRPSSSRCERRLKPGRVGTE